MGQRLLYIHVLAEGHGVRGDAGVGVVGGGDHNGINGVVHLVEHSSPVPIPFGAGVIVEAGLRVLPVDVTQRDDVLARHVFQVGPAVSSDADPGDVQPVARSGLSRSCDDAARQYRQPGGGRCGCADKLSPRNTLSFALLTHSTPLSSRRLIWWSMVPPD